LNEKIESNKIDQDQEFVIQKKSENTEEIKLLETTDKINLENNNKTFGSILIYLIILDVFILANSYINLLP